MRHSPSDVRPDLGGQPWYWFVVLVAAALVASGIVISNERSRAIANDQAFRSAQLLRLSAMQQRVADYFGKADQLVDVGAQTFDDLQPGDVVGARKLAIAMYRSRTDPEVYGVGPFYEQFAFAPEYRLFSVYVHTYDTYSAAHIAAYDVVHPNKIDEAFFKYTGPDRPVHYVHLSWFTAAAAAHGGLIYDGPYTEDLVSYITTAKAFYRNGSLLGVMTVDIKTERFKHFLASPVSGDVAWLIDPRGRWMLGTAPRPPPSPARIVASLALAVPQGSLYLSSDSSALLAQNSAVLVWSIGFVAAIWILAALVGVGLYQRARATGARRRLEAERVELESELAIQKKVEGELRKAAYTDSLTGLPNRAAFLEDASARIATAGKTPSSAVFFIDLDRFNLINDTLGHFTGDEVLKITAMRLRRSLPPEASIARMGGDEFVVLMQTPPGDVGERADAILSILREPLLLRGRITYTDASIGIVPVEAAYRQPEDLLRDVDIAMYAAKRAGRGCYAIFDTRMRGHVEAQSDLERDLRRAIERHEFVAYYQPIVSTRTGRVTSVEALVRWLRPGAGIVNAGEFVAFAERAGLIDDIDSMVLDSVCADMPALGEHLGNAGVAVNISAAHLTAPHLADDIRQTLRKSGVDPGRIKIEITETAMMSNAEVAQDAVAALHGGGVRIVLDDFGTGHSSLAYLHRLPIVGLKIDRSFIEPLARDRDALAIVRSIVGLAQNLDLYTVAEGVETAEQLAIVKELGIPFAQGFYFSAALPLADLLRYVGAPVVS